VRTLVNLPRIATAPHSVDAAINLRFEAGYWGRKEHAFAPPTSLLAWMINNPAQLRQKSSTLPKRHTLLQGDIAARDSALAALSTRAAGRGWHILEGATYPDVTIFTPQAIIVVEGKRTEAGPTLDTTWLAGRHQMWRHIEGAWCVRGS
jgi:hypothetical protein